MKASLYPQTVTTDRGDAEFLRRLYRSVGPLFLVAAYFVLRGHDVRILGMKVRPDRTQWREYSDEGDLFVTLKDGEERRFEVKSTTRDFGMNGAGWPFPDMLVCSEKDWNRADPKPHAFFIVNPAGTVAAIVRSEQMTTNRVRPQPDNERNTVYPAYAIPPRELRFVELS